MLISRGPLRYQVEKAIEASDRCMMISQSCINFLQDCLTLGKSFAFLGQSQGV